MILKITSSLVRALPGHNRLTSRPPRAADRFGWSLALTGDGNTLAVGAVFEGSNSSGVNGDQDNNFGMSGAVYLFTRMDTTWSQQAFIKASNTDANDFYGGKVAISGDGTTLAVGATGEDSAASGIGGDQNSNSAARSGAVYLY